MTALFKDTKKFGYDLIPQTVTRISEFPLDWPHSFLTKAKTDSHQQTVKILETLEVITNKRKSPRKKKQIKERNEEEIATMREQKQSQENNK